MDDRTTAGVSPSKLTSADIARRAGVSVSAVSLAFNDRPGLSATTRARILDIAQELNWRPHRAARALKGARADVIGLAVARPARTLSVEPFFAHILSGLQSRFSHDSISLQFLIVEDVTAEIAAYRRWAAERRVDGVVFLDLSIDDPRPAVLADLGLPAVMLGGQGDEPRVSSVWVDDFGAMVHLLEYLSALGHRRIGHVSGTPTLHHTHRRLQAIGEISSSLGIDVRSTHTDFSDAQGADATRRLLSRTDRPSAIIYDNDVMAVAGLGIASEMGVSVPERLSIVSFDDSLLTRMTHPTITSLSRDTGELGAQVASQLLSLVRDGGPHVHVQGATPHLEIRGSSAPPVA